MEVPFRLARRDASAVADAVLLCDPDRGTIAAACAKLGGAKLPLVFAVRGGFLLIPRDAVAHAPPGAVRLRRLAGDVFIPVDAELLPALVPEESTSLTRDRGLVVLPGGEVLAFDPDAPLTPDEWLTPGRVRAREWRPFPSRPPRVDSLTTIERPVVPVDVVVILDAGKPDGAEPMSESGPVPEGARPAAGSAVDRARAGAQLGLGRFLAWLGRRLGSRKLRQAGGDMARGAVDRAPRLSERVLGEQEAALREVLRQLKGGDVERALRHAPVAVSDPNAGGGRVGTDATLSARDPRYSLRSLLGAGSGGAAWLGGGDVWADLAREYRRLAAAAQSAGDHRRAAYLYGVLLRDIRSAANTLMAGGLHRDAALLFRDRLNDETAAAHAFEQAGDYDEALRLYEKRGHFSNCGWVLRRLGDDGRADDFFRRAAEEMAREGRWLSAAGFIDHNAGHLGLSREYHRRGWQADGSEGVLCGVKLFDDLAAAGEVEPLGELVTEAEARFVPPRVQDAGRFFNHACAARLPVEVRADLLDRTRVLFAAHLRSPAGARAGDLATELFARGPWAPPVNRDAAFATRVIPRKPPTAPDLLPSVRLVGGPVTAVAVAGDAGDVFAAGGGDFVRWCVADGRVIRVGPFHPHDVLAIACDPTGAALYAIHREGGELSLRCSEFTGSGYDLRAQQPLPDDTDWRLHPPRYEEGQYTILLTSRWSFLQFGGWNLQARPTTQPDPHGDEERVHLLLDPRPTEWWEWKDTTIKYIESMRKVNARFVVPWQPRVPSGCPLTAAPVDWATPMEAVLEVAGLDAVGNVYWSEFDARDRDHPRSRTAVAPHEDKFRAACLVAAGQVAAVSDRNEVHWFRALGGNTLARSSSPRALPFPARAAAVVARSGEVVVILEDGLAVRVPRA